MNSIVSKLTAIFNEKIHEAKFVAISMLLILAASTSLLPASQPALAQQPVLRLILFWSDGCPHCHDVIDHVLPPLKAKYGDQMEISMIEVASMEDFDTLLQVAEAYGLTRQQVGVPFMIVGDQVLIGSNQIPAELPGLMEKHLAAGGLDLPQIPALEGLLPAQESQPPALTHTNTPPALPVPTSPAAGVEVESSSAKAEYPSGYFLAIAILAGMVAALLYAGYVYAWGYQAQHSRARAAWLEYATPLLAAMGLFLAGYLAYVETQHVTAVCGPVGDCNAVQNSPYATLFGVIPVGVIGLAGYLLILAAWFIRRMNLGWLSAKANLAIFLMALFGTLYSLYLTYLEPFVIKAVCAWCLTSAVIITLLMLVSLTPAMQHLITEEVD